ncbi:MAG TPA: type II secretion system protein GspG [Gemmataceae bacterium]|nr:type II secretion system protein GspG [Gemmataceae bacterium]
MMLAATRRRTARRAAFTLLEVLVVVAILVILAGVGVVATTRYLEDARKSKAQLGCQGLMTAIEAFHVNPNSGGAYPDGLQQLVSPPWGGTSFLKDPQADLTDPWGNHYQIQMITGNDGAETPVVFTRAPDGTPISNYGIGPASRMQ